MIEQSHYCDLACWGGVGGAGLTVRRATGERRLLADKATGKHAIILLGHLIQWSIEPSIHRLVSYHCPMAVRIRV